MEISLGKLKQLVAGGAFICGCGWLSVETELLEDACKLEKHGKTVDI